MLSLKIVFGLDAAFFGFLEQVSAINDRGQVKRQCAFALSALPFSDHNRKLNSEIILTHSTLMKKANWALSSIKPKIGASHRSAASKHVMGKSHSIT